MTGNFKILAKALFVGNLISQISQKAQICKIELPQNGTLYIDSKWQVFPFSRN